MRVVLKKDILHQFYKKQGEYKYHKRFDKFGVSALEIPRSKVIAEKTKASRDKPEDEQNFPTRQIDIECRDIGGHIDDLADSVCLPQAEMDHPGEQ